MLHRMLFDIIYIYIYTHTTHIKCDNTENRYIKCNRSTKREISDLTRTLGVSDRARLSRAPFKGTIRTKWRKLCIVYSRNCGIIKLNTTCETFYEFYLECHCYNTDKHQNEIPFGDAWMLYRSISVQYSTSDRERATFALTRSSNEAIDDIVRRYIFLSGEG